MLLGMIIINGFIHMHIINNVLASGLYIIYLDYVSFISVATGHIYDIYHGSKSILSILGINDMRYATLCLTIRSQPMPAPTNHLSSANIGRRVLS